MIQALRVLLLSLYAALAAPAFAQTPPADDMHDRFALALAFQKQCGGLPVWEEFMLSHYVNRTWGGSRVDKANEPKRVGIDEAIPQDRPKYAARVKAAGCQGDNGLRVEVSNLINVDAVAFTVFAEEMAKLPPDDPGHRFLTAQEAALIGVLRNGFGQQYGDQLPAFTKAVNDQLPKLAAADPLGGRISTATNLLFSAMVLDASAQQAKLQIKLSDASELYQHFEAVETGTNRIWRGIEFPNVQGSDGKHNKERPYGMMLLGPDGNLAHVLIDVAAPVKPTKSLIAPRIGLFGDSKTYAYGQVITGNCPWQVCTSFTKADTDRPANSAFGTQLDAYVETDVKDQNMFSQSIGAYQLKALLPKP